ncbi:MAG: hypothetical protein ACOYK6_00380 [Chthoniobacterales bacterium]
MEELLKLAPKEIYREFTTIVCMNVNNTTIGIGPTAPSNQILSRTINHFGSVEQSRSNLITSLQGALDDFTGAERFIINPHDGTITPTEVSTAEAGRSMGALRSRLKELGWKQLLQNAAFTIGTPLTRERLEGVIRMLRGHHSSIDPASVCPSANVAPIGFNNSGPITTSVTQVATPVEQLKTQCKEVQEEVVAEAQKIEKAVQEAKPVINQIFSELKKFEYADTMRLLMALDFSNEYDPAEEGSFQEHQFLSDNNHLYECFVLNNVDPPFQMKTFPARGEEGETPPAIPFITLVNLKGVDGSRSPDQFPTPEDNKVIRNHLYQTLMVFYGPLKLTNSRAAQHTFRKEREQDYIRSTEVGGILNELNCVPSPYIMRLADNNNVYNDDSFRVVPNPDLEKVVLPYVTFKFELKQISERYAPFTDKERALLIQCRDILGGDTTTEEASEALTALEHPDQALASAPWYLAETIGRGSAAVGNSVAVLSHGFASGVVANAPSIGAASLAAALLGVTAGGLSHALLGENYEYTGALWGSIPSSLLYGAATGAFIGSAMDAIFQPERNTFFHNVINSRWPYSGLRDYLNYASIRTWITSYIYMALGEVLMGSTGREIGSLVGQAAGHVVGGPGGAAVGAAAGTAVAGAIHHGTLGAMRAMQNVPEAWNSFAPEVALQNFRKAWSDLTGERAQRILDELKSAQPSAEEHQERMKAIDALFKKLIPLFTKDSHFNTGSLVAARDIILFRVQTGFQLRAALIVQLERKIQEEKVKAKKSVKQMRPVTRGI